MVFQKEIEGEWSSTIEVSEEVIVIEFFLRISRCGEVLRLQLERKGRNEERSLETFT